MSLSPPRWSRTRLIAFHLAPGAVALLVFAGLTVVPITSELPAMTTLFLAILLGEVPTAWLLMVRTARLEGCSVGALLPWRESIGWGRTLLLGPPLILGSMILLFGVGAVLEARIQPALFDWVPPAFVLETGPASMLSLSSGQLLLLWVLSGVAGVVIGGTTQEIYHRGFLLPRADHLGAQSVPFNALWFAIGHLNSPWGWPGFFLVSLPWAWAVRRWHSLRLGLVGHVGMLAVGWLMMTAIVFGWLPVPSDRRGEPAVDEVTSAVIDSVERFEQANSERNSDAIVALLWPDFVMRADGAWLDREEVSAASHAYMAGLMSLHTVWSDVRVLPLTADLAVASFLFRDSVVDTAGVVTISEGPTSLVWERRALEWRMIFADADHRVVTSSPDGG